MDYTFWFEMHSGIRWLVILMFIVVLFRFVAGYFRKANFAAIDGRLLSVYNVLISIQAVLGIVVLFARNFEMNGAIWAHLLFMVLAVGVAAGTSGRVRRADNDHSRYRIGMIGTLLSAVLVVIGITMIGGW